MLTIKERNERNKGLGGSDSNRIMRGDWLDVYKEKRGEAEPANLDHMLNVQIGIATESVNLDFLERELGEKMVRDVTVKTDNHIMSHLDGMTVTSRVPVEAKHTYEGNTMEAVAETNYPQLQHYMMHTGKTHMHLAVIFGNRRWEQAVIDADYTYQQKLEKVLAYLWDCIQTGTTPISLDLPITPPKEDIKLNGMVKKDMSDTREWIDLAKEFYNYKPMAKHFDECKKAIKDLVSDDCREARGNGVVVTRNKKNILTIKEEKKTDE